MEKQNHLFMENSINGYYVLHIDPRPGTELRGDVFGHPDSILSFREGYLAKNVGAGELSFYTEYRKNLNEVFANDLLPTVYGLIYIKSIKSHQDGSHEVHFYFDHDLTINDNNLKDNEKRFPRAMLLQKDVTAGYQKPAIVDLKLGIRSWRIGASHKKAERRTLKMQKGVCHLTKFRIRAAMWYHDGDQEKNDNILNGKYTKDGELTVANRYFGNTCTMDELRLFFTDFLKVKASRQQLIQKLRRLSQALTVLHDKFGVRFYSSSLLMVYDDTNPSKFDVRILDFEKTYVNVEKICSEFHEPLEDAEDGVAEAVENVAKFIESL